jgi:hypothetical protein
MKSEIPIFYYMMVGFETCNIPLPIGQEIVKLLDVSIELKI